MRLALLLVASLALVGTVAGLRKDGRVDGCGRVFPNRRPLTVPKSQFNKYLGLAFEFATRMSMLRRKMYHLLRIEHIKWQSKSKLIMKITNVFSSCRKVPWFPYYFAQCKPNYRKGTATCWATIDLLPRSLNIKRIYGPTCREYTKKTPKWPKRPNRLY
ncbi:uncharacterized protein LOC125946648 [Dermacentor silvarum]|uniref:uncharacterized protein LOC125946648 n=1 Tax=Dermacentor silvarum TaxID=543639 RepID=UPI002101C161|nr:uncharacterized protein LOC125946648 [Dermacentor silvarum]